MNTKDIPFEPDQKKESRKVLRQHTVIAFGELLWDLMPGHTILGGAPFNFAYRLSTLGDRAVPVSRVGCDELGRQAIHQVQMLGLDTSYLQLDSQHPTGTVSVSFDPENNPEYLIIPGVAYDYIEKTEKLQELASAADCICFGTLVQRSGVSRGTLECLLNHVRTPKILDINLRKECYSREIVIGSLRAADILKANEQEILELAGILQMPRLPLPGLTTQILRDWSLQYIVVTLGEKGALALSAEGQMVYIPGYKVRLVDSLGSGDAFSAGFVHSLLQGMNLAEACRLGNLLGALVATTAGGTTPIAREELELFKERKCERICDPGLVRFMA